METNQVLSVAISIPSSLKDAQFFFAKMEKDGRVNIPPLVLSALQAGDTSLSDLVLEIILEPVTNIQQ
jgi:hypothetical protein